MLGNSYKTLGERLVPDQIALDLEVIHYPRPSWVEASENQYDVAIIGAGMAGIAAGFALKLLGINNIQLFDQGGLGSEGPWMTYARMPTLRSAKDLVGPALDMPGLTFQRWYESTKGSEEWLKLGKIPNKTWMEYLLWLRHTLRLPVQNDQRLVKIIPEKNGLLLTLNERKITASKVVLATGRGGFGGAYVPPFAAKLPREGYAHTNDPIDFGKLKGRRVGIMGAGASGFDAAASALENHAYDVTIFLRRERVPSVNKGVSNIYEGFMEGFFDLSDAKKWKLMKVHYRDGVPPPFDALERVKDYQNFAVQLGAGIEDASYANDEILLQTARGTWKCDFLIFATGFAMDGSKQPELSSFFDSIRLWGDQKSIGRLKAPEWFCKCPYLGPHFQFMEKKKGSASFLKHLYCFNYAAVLSHGQISGDIPGIGVGAMRLSRGIASDFFAQDWKRYYQRLQQFQNLTFDDNLYSFFQSK